MPIRKLPPLLINQIAAGEVIERPASVVKELIENSLDAGATRIDVAVEDGGLQLLRIADNGHGIPPEELPLALTAHATSKLQTAEQLAAIDTLGFRGEALASIASVSRLKLASRTPGDDAGHALEQAGPDRSPLQPVAMAPGTVLEIRDLFFNTPARRKFMRTAATEFGHIADTVARVAMVHPHVGFTLTHQQRQTLDLPPREDRRQRCVGILGQELEPALLEFDYQAPLPLGKAEPSPEADPAPQPARVWGLVGEPSIARGSAKFQYLCVNGRPVKDRNLAHALKEAFRGLVAPDKHPVAVVFVELDPALVDVNVHPTKSEVRFRHPSAVHGLVLSQIRQRLLATDLVPQASLASASPWNKPLRPAPAANADAPSPPTADAFVDYFKSMDPKQKGFVYDEVRREMAAEDLFEDADRPGPDRVAPAPPSSETKPILQFHNSYVVAPDHTPGREPGLLIVDQHALHERIMFEELRQRILLDAQNLESQRLLMPAIVDADPKRQALVPDLKPLLTRLGVELEPLGPAALGVHAFPSLLFDRGVDPVAFTAELLDKAEAGDLSATDLRPDADAATAEAVLHQVLDMMSCKAAVKAGDRLSDDELAALLTKRDEIERSSSCPHGRPTTVRLSLKDLEKQFHRA
ncbi:MAG: DNA mismatch repair endonuclease MutL [Planctomycetota bacterium]